MDWSEKNLCIKCNEGGSLLVCSENGCPLAIHRGCMVCPARFDGDSHFYCPYCLYKRTVAESRQAREYALARKKDLLKFMAADVIPICKEKQSEVNEGLEANGLNQSKVNEENVHVTTCGDVNVTGGEEEEVLEEEIKEQNSNEKSVHIEEHDEASAASSGQNPSLKMHQNEENILEEETETFSDSSGQDTLPLRERAKRVSKRRKTMDGISEAVSVRSKLVIEIDKNNNQTSPAVNSPTRSSRRSPSGLRIEEVKSGKSVEVPKSLRKNELPPVKLVNDTFVSGKRKRLLWSEEEEEALKAGVQKHLKEPNINLPWRKILDMGRNVFDGTRTPSDLKDKWRNMSTK